MQRLETPTCFTSPGECWRRFCLKPRLFLCVLSRVCLFATPWIVARHAFLSMGFPRQEYWTGLPFPTPGDLPDQGIELRSSALPADSLSSEPLGTPWFLLRIPKWWPSGCIWPSAWLAITAFWEAPPRKIIALSWGRSFSFRKEIDF